MPSTNLNYGQKVELGKQLYVDTRLSKNNSDFTDNGFHNLGVARKGLLKEDLRRYDVTRREQDKGAFKTPTMRSVVEAAPYRPDGSKPWKRSIEFKHNDGGVNPRLSPLMKPLELTPEERTDLLAFLHALTGAPFKVTMPKLPK